MGVDYYTCQLCKDTFPDCGYYFCCTNCEGMFCSDKCGQRQNSDVQNKYGEDLTSCVFCRNEAVTDYTLLYFLCNKYGISKEDATKEYLEDRKNGK